MTNPLTPRHRTLRFEGGASHTTILDASDGDPDIRTDFGAVGPGTASELVVVRRPDFADRMLHRPPPRNIWLPAGGLWSVEIAGAAAQVEIDLDATAVRGVDIQGSVSHLTLRLRAPDDWVPIGITGSVSALTLQRPASVPVTVTVRGSVRDLQVDHHAIRAAAGPIILGGALDGPVPGYQLRIDGSAADLRVGAGPM